MSGLPSDAVGEWANPSGLCLCGCGIKTNRAHQAVRVRGVLRYRKGDYFRYYIGHGPRGLAPSAPALSGYTQTAREGR